MRARDPLGLAIILALSLHSLRAQEDVTFELMEGSTLTHEWGEDDLCLGEFKIVDISGTFVLALEQPGDGTSLAGKIHDIQFTSVPNADYHISGSGSYSESIRIDSPIAVGNNPASLSLRLKINEIPEVFLSFEAAGGNSLIFPALKGGVLQADQQRRDCFILVIKASPQLGQRMKFFRRGDVNGDGVRDIADPISALSYLLFGNPGITCLDAADCDDDGKIDLSDAVLLVEHLFLGGGYPAIPNRFCGLDYSDDAWECEGQPACSGTS